MSKRDLIKLFNNSNVRFIALFLFAAVAGIFLILSLNQLWSL
ncbi:hypothetical protein OQ279_03850 [Salinimicrobium sp. MT39]|uniref:Uncharacterized protein n=1 Tax=Salinimicrobium profundisediminis TaxID=2994553 RepID=A0A9X3HZT3_9FLAO|nr:hypothetical protein [Salinimicrobium profundisediminis]MCX2837275.1 hypothetical protein [Salinimicrobium profundisediminis]